MEEAPAVWMFLGGTMPIVLFYIFFPSFSQNLEGNTESLYAQVCKIPPEEQEQLYANMAPRQQRAAQ